MYISHDEQRKVWEEEHKASRVFPHIASLEVSGGVRRFWEKYLSLNNGMVNDHVGLEIGCGKGRNVLWLAKQGIRVVGFDFSSFAIKKAKSRVSKEAQSRVSFLEHDAMRKWPFGSSQFNFAIDCFVSTDIEGERNRSFVAKEIFRILKPGGYLFLYTNSINSELYKKMLSCGYGTREQNAFYYPKIKKFEKVYEVSELDCLYRNFCLIDSEIYTRYSKVNNKNYEWEHFWRIYQKPC